MTTHAYTPPPGLEAAMRKGRCKMVWGLVEGLSLTVLDKLRGRHEPSLFNAIINNWSPYAVGDVLVHETRRNVITSVDCLKASDVTEEMARRMGYRGIGYIDDMVMAHDFFRREVANFDTAWVWIYKVESDGSE